MKKEFPHVMRLCELGACTDAVNYARQFEDPQKAWDECKRGNDMLWLLGNLSGKPGSDARKKLVLCACECARLALKYVKPGEDRPLKAIETAERWARGEDGVDLAMVRRAANAAYAAAAYAAYATYAAYAAPAYAAYAAADAAASYTAAAAAYAAVTAELNTLKLCADIVRRHYPIQPFSER